MKDFDSLNDDEKREYDKVVSLKLAQGDIEGIVRLVWQRRASIEVRSAELMLRLS